MPINMKHHAYFYIYNEICIYNESRIKYDISCQKHVKNWDWIYTPWLFVVQAK